MPVFARVPEVAATTVLAARRISNLRGGDALTLLLKLNRLAMDRAQFLDGMRRALGPRVELAVVDAPEHNVAGTWNEFVAWSAARGDDKLLIMNHDALLEPDAVAQLADFSDGEALLWTGVNVLAFPHTPRDEVVEAPDFSCFMVEPRTFAAAFGRFDENFSPAYFEDNDAHARIVLGGRRALRLGAARYHHLGSNVVKHDGAAAVALGPLFHKNAAYFHCKWGRSPVNAPAEMRRAYFSRPFNDASLGINDWRPPSTRALL